jgi:hypothetical protein
MSTQPYTLHFVLQPPAYARMRTPDRSWAEFLVEDTTHSNAPAELVLRHEFSLTGTLPEQVGPFMVEGELAHEGARYSLRVCVRFHQGETLEPGDMRSTFAHPIVAGPNSFKIPLSVVTSTR